MPKITIENQGGTSKIYVDGEQLKNVTSIRIEKSIDNHCLYEIDITQKFITTDLTIVEDKQNANE